MKLLNIGSLNIDHVYQVKAFVQAGETISSQDYQRFVGGKGCNQSIALARAGACVKHLGKVGADGLWLKQALIDSGVDGSYVAEDGESTGHAIIQVDKHGQNCIILHGGANKQIDLKTVDLALEELSANDYVLLQNEINDVAEIILKAKQKGVKVVFNPAPITEKIKSYPLDQVDIFILNEIEAKCLTGATEPKLMLDTLVKNFPAATVILTLGEQGVMASENGDVISIPAKSVEVVDSTGAGDTFIGFYLAMHLQGKSLKESLQTAVEASAICVAREGAAASIPKITEVC